VTDEWWSDKTKFPKGFGDPKMYQARENKTYFQIENTLLNSDAEDIGEGTEIVVEIMGGLIGDPKGIYTIDSKNADLKESNGLSAVAQYLERALSKGNKGAVVDINIDNQYRYILSSELWGNEEKNQYGPVSLWVKTNPQNAQKAIEYAKQVRETDEVISVYVETQDDTKNTKQDRQDKPLFSYNEKDMQYHGKDFKEEVKVHTIVSAIEALNFYVNNLTNKKISKIKLNELEIDVGPSTTYGYKA